VRSEGIRNINRANANFSEADRAFVRAQNTMLYLRVPNGDRVKACYPPGRDPRGTVI